METQKKEKMKVNPTIQVETSKLVPNPNNPRFIKDKEFEELKKSITNFPDMMSARPIVVDENWVVLGGNMRFRAVMDLKWTKVPVIMIEGATEQWKKEFVIKDNVNKGSWDYEMLANEWEIEDLTEWGIAESNFGVSAPEFMMGDEDGMGVQGDLEAAMSAPTSDIKLLQLFFTEDNHKEFVTMATEMMKRLGQSNITDTIFKIVHDAYTKIQTAADRK